MSGYVWTTVGIDALNRNSLCERFNNPKANDVVSDVHLECWRRSINRPTLTMEDLVTYDLAKVKVIVPVVPPRHLAKKGKKVSKRK